MAGLTLFLAVLASWGILHTVAVFMRHHKDVIELNRRVKILRAEYLGRSKARRNAPEAVIEVRAADSHRHAA